MDRQNFFSEWVLGPEGGEIKTKAEEGGRMRRRRERDGEREDVHQGWWRYSVLSLNHSLPPPPTLPLSHSHLPPPTTTHQQRLIQLNLQPRTTPNYSSESPQAWSTKYRVHTYTAWAATARSWSPEFKWSRAQTLTAPLPEPGVSGSSA